MPGTGDTSGELTVPGFFAFMELLVAETDIMNDGERKMFSGEKKILAVERRSCRFWGLISGVLTLERLEPGD